MRQRTRALSSAGALLAALLVFGGCQLSNDNDGVGSDIVIPDVVIPDIVIPDIGMSDLGGTDVGSPDTGTMDTGGGMDTGPNDVASDGAAPSDTTSADTGPGTDAESDTGADTTTQAGCGPPAIDPGAIVLPAEDFATPVDIASGDSYMFVASANEDGSGTPGQGFITVLSLADRSTVNRIPTSMPRPTVVTMTPGDAVWRVLVVERGLLGDARVAPLPDGPGGFERLTEVDADTAQIFEEALVVQPSGRVGAPDSVAIVGVATGDVIFLGSATTGAVLSFAGDSCAPLRGVDDPIVVGDLDSWHELHLSPGSDRKVWIADTATGLVHIYDPEADELNPATGRAGAPYDLGSCAPTHVLELGTGEALVLCPGEDAIAAIASDGSISLDRYATGGAPSVFTTMGDTLYVLNTGDDALQRIDLSTGDSELSFATLPAGAGPVAFAITPDESEMWIANAGNDTVSVIDLSDGSLTTTLGD